MHTEGSFQQMVDSFTHIGIESGVQVCEGQCLHCQVLVPPVLLSSFFLPLAVYFLELSPLLLASSKGHPSMFDLIPQVEIIWQCLHEPVLVCLSAQQVLTVDDDVLKVQGEEVLE